MGARTKKAKKRFIQLAALVAVVIIAVNGFRIYAAIQHQNMVKLTVDKSEYKPGTDLPLKKGKDYRFAVETISIKNNSSDPIQFDPLTQIVLVDNKGIRYGPSTIQVDQPLKSGTIAGHATTSGQVSFIVGNQTQGGFKLNLTLKNENLELSADATPSL